MLVTLVWILITLVLMLAMVNAADARHACICVTSRHIYVGSRDTVLALVMVISDGVQHTIVGASHDLVGVGHALVGAGHALVGACHARIGARHTLVGAGLACLCARHGRC